jgi:Fur family peroxide stress response transcriptional regulator
MDALDILKQHNIKATIQRVKVLEYLMNCSIHPNAEDIYMHLKNELPMISLSSVYNILIEFEKNNLVNKLMTDNNTIRYDYTKCKHYHIYYSDGKIEDFEDKELDNLISEYFNKNYPDIVNDNDINVVINIKNKKDKQPTKK